VIALWLWLALFPHAWDRPLTYPPERYSVPWVESRFPFVLTVRRFDV
jgi:hypothetical protein